MAQVAAVVWVQSLIPELLHAVGTAKKKKKKAQHKVISAMIRFLAIAKNNGVKNSLKH